MKLTTQTTLGQLLDAGLISSFNDILNIKKGGSGKTSGSRSGSGSTDLDGTFIVPEPKTSGEMLTFMKKVIAEHHAGSDKIKTKVIQEALFGEGRVPGPQDSGRPAMKRTWDLISANWKVLITEGFVFKSSRYAYGSDKMNCEIWMEENAELFEDEVQEEVETHVPSQLVQEVEVQDDETKVEVDDSELSDAGDLDWSDLD